MIILDGEAEQTPKNDNYQGLTLRHPQAAVTRSSSPLPDYDTSEAQHLKISEARKPRSLFDSMVWRGALYAFVIYVFLSLVIVIPVLVVKARARKKQNNLALDPTGSLWAVEDNDFSAPIHLSSAGLTILDDNKLCNSWNHTSSNISRAFFTVPPVGTVAIRSNITYNTFSLDQITGHLSVSRNKDAKKQDVLFSVDMQFSSPELQGRTNVCFNSLGPNRGLSIYVPAKLAKNDHLDFKINVVLPQAGASFDKFITYLPMISQQFDDFGALPSPLFNQLSIEGAVRPITCKFLSASKILVKNLGSSIEGAFDVTSAITLDSVKGSIFSDITLTQPTQPDMAYRPTFLTIETGDSAINANVTLNSQFISTLSPNSPTFVAKVTTFNGPLDLSIKYSNKASSTLPLQLQVQNNLAVSSIFLAPAYQGLFSARTKMSQVITAEPAEYNATGKSSVGSRTIIYDQKLEDTASGWVGGWGERPFNNRRVAQSTVDIVSALSPISLTFG
ncbi:hypothetical protein CVT25_011042 [Psilocybe cyanescens]|uniref:Uncharacterized protein n=1 Tax=Psilocybe cyanescens TaxID=93625 RepID=A0A409WFB5_PSICY|nr:hypothetical protein CVT25_011042 [Psilocybe cyanescens]